MAWVSMKSTWHAAATDLHPVKGSEKDGLGQHGVHMACSSHRLTSCQGVKERWPGSAWSPHGMQQPQTYFLSRCQKKMAWVSKECTWHAAATNFPTVKVSKKDGLGQHGVHMACSSYRLTHCQGVREKWPGSAWSPHGMQQPQTYFLSRCYTKMAWVSMESTWHAAATDLLSVNVSEKDGLSMESTWHATTTDLQPVKVSEKDGHGQHEVHMASSSYRLTLCQGVRERWPGSTWSPDGMQQPQTYLLSRRQKKMAWVSMESTWHAVATDLHPVKMSQKDGL